MRLSCRHTFNTDTIDASTHTTIWHLDRSHFVLYTEDKRLATHLSKLTKCEWSATYYGSRWVAEQFIFPTTKKKQILRLLKQRGIAFEFLSE